VSQPDPIEEFEAILHTITGLVLDSFDAYALLQAKLEQEVAGASWDVPIYYGDGPVGEATSVAHVTTIADRIARNADAGQNAIFVGNLALVAIYSYWEDNSRGRIAAIKGVVKDALVSDVMGDIRHLRHAIIHNKAVANDDVAKSRVLKWFVAGDDIFISEQMFLQMISCVRAYLHELRSS
jgi:hypothetical protein